MDTPDINPVVSVSQKVQKMSDFESASESVLKNSAQTDTSRTSNRSAPVVIPADLEKAIEILNEALSKDPVSLQFRIDETLNRPVVSVISEATGEVIHQLPQEEVLRAVKNLDAMRGILFDDMG